MRMGSASATALLWTPDWGCKGGQQVTGRRLGEKTGQRGFIEEEVEEEEERGEHSWLGQAAASVAV